MEETQDEQEKGLVCVRVVNTHPDKVNDEGKRNLAIEIIEEISVGDVTKFIKFWGYKS